MQTDFTGGGGGVGDSTLKITKKISKNALHFLASWVPAEESPWAEMPIIYPVLYYAVTAVFFYCL